MKSNEPQQIHVFYGILAGCALLMTPSVMLLFKLFNQISCALYMLK